MHVVAVREDSAKKGCYNHREVVNEIIEMSVKYCTYDTLSELGFNLGDNVKGIFWEEQRKRIWKREADTTYHFGARLLFLGFFLIDPGLSF